MVYQDVFEVEKFMDEHEKDIVYNLGETCCYSLSINDLTKIGSESDSTSSKSLCDLLGSDRLTYGNIEGSHELKREICRLYDAENPAENILPENIIITNGGIAANFLTFYSWIDKNDHVIVVDPTYQQLNSVPSVFSSKNNVDLLELKYDNGYLPDLKKLKELIRPTKTKMIVINNPNNPTGLVWNSSILENIVSICKDYGIYLLCDEVYRPLYHSTSCPPKSIINYGYDRAISTSSVSKAFSLAGIRVGWIVCRDTKFIASASEHRHYNTISVSVLDDKLATYALSKHEKIIERNYKLCRENLNKIEAFIESSNGLLEWVRPQGGATAFIKINRPNLNTYDMCQELTDKYKCLLVPGEVFGGRRGFVRVGFGNSSEDLEGGITILKNYFKEKRWL